MAPRTDEIRYARQILLPQVGAEGQTRLGQNEFVPNPDLGADTAEVARLFARAAGLAGSTGSPRVIGSPSAQVKAFFRHPPARAVGLGASAALDAAAKVLSLSGVSA